MKLHLCLLALLCLAAASHAAVPMYDKDCVTGKLDTGVDSFFPQRFYVDGYAPTKSKVSFAQGFSVEYFDTYKLVTITSTNETYCLYQCGSTAPAASELPKGTRFFSIPLSSTSVQDTTVIAFMAELGLLDRVSYVTQYAISPCMQKLAMSKAAGGCGLTSSSPAGDKTDANNTLLLSQTSSVASVWAFGTFGFSSVPAMAAKAISFPASADPGTLRRAEWLKYVALFFNKEPEANARFDAIAAAYNATRAAALKAAGTSKPLVAWAGSFMGMVSISLAPYKNDYITDAGGVPMKLADIRAAGGAAVTCQDPATFGPGPCTATSTTAMINSTTAAGAAALRKVLADVDVLIDETFLSAANVTTADVLEAYGFTSTDRLPFLTNKRVFRLDANVKLPATADDAVALEWFETAVARPDLVLEDMVVAITPAAIKDAGAPAYVRNVATQKPRVVSASQCKTLTGCSASPQPICPYVYKDCTTGELKYVTADNRCGPSCTSAPATPLAPTTAAKNTTGTKANSAGAMRPLLTVFALIVCLIEALIHLF